VRRSLQRLGLRPVYKRPYRVTTDSTHRLPVAPNLLDRRFDGWQSNQACVSDITFISTGEGWSELVCQTLRSTCWQRKPVPGLLLNSDRSPGFR
jgi:transposase InsO family protein